MMDQNFLENQTIFAEEEPLHVANRKKRTLESVATVKKPPSWLYAGAVILILISIVGGAATFLRKGQQQPITTVEATPTPIPQTSSQIDQMILELQTAVDNADPSRTTLPFPPVADQIKVSP